MLRRAVLISQGSFLDPHRALLSQSAALYAKCGDSYEPRVSKLVSESRGSRPSDSCVTRARLSSRNKPRAGS